MLWVPIMQRFINNYIKSYKKLLGKYLNFLLPTNEILGTEIYHKNNRDLPINNEEVSRKILDTFEKDST